MVYTTRDKEITNCSPADGASEYTVKIGTDKELSDAKTISVSENSADKKYKVKQGIIYRGGNIDKISDAGNEKGTHKRVFLFRC
ncbi:MAG: hypothetical protein K6E58_02235 [Eubacterium sp.]|nr:hypothetical protein [Eubacterium sp.]